MPPTGLVRYGEHEPVAPGSACVLCAVVALRPVQDHCHDHGWLRGVLCGRCNTAMAYVDRRITPRAALAAGLSLADLLAHAGRCPECLPLTVADLGPTASLRPAVPSLERPTTVRLRADISAAVREVAQELGISFNAALSVLVTEALKARGRHPGPQRKEGAA